MTASLLAKIGGGFAPARLAAVFVPRLGDADADVHDLAVLLATGAAAGLLLVRLNRARYTREEQIAIGLGARLGNGVLICLLAWLLLGGEGATDAARAAIVCGLAALFLASTAALAARPERVVIGYKG